MSESETATAQRKAVIVTGASDGIGAELARVFAARGHEVALVARRKERLDALADDIAAAGAPRPLVVGLDLAEPGAPQALDEALEQAGLAPEILVNNAGYGLMGAAAELDEAEQLGVVDLNIRALTALTLRFLPPIIAAKGAVLNVASVAAMMPGPHFAVYYASKAYVLSFSEALSEEMKPHGVKVSCLCPGQVATGFQERARFDFSGTMRAMKPAVISAAEVARQGYEGLMAGQRVIIPGAVTKILAASSRATPNALLLPLLAAVQRRR